MRLKEDSSSWKASNITRKIVELPDEPIKKSKKNTRRWCKGKVGVEHDYFLFYQHDSKYFHFKIYKCKACGKKKHV